MVKGRRLGSSCVSPLVPRAPDLGCTGLDLHVAHPTEAAFTLLLYCELLQWEERPLREFLHYPSQTEWQRKEGLCRKIIHYFSKGKVGPAAAGAGLWGVPGREWVDARMCTTFAGSVVFSWVGAEGVKNQFGE